MTAPSPAEAYEKVYVPTFFSPLGNALLDRTSPARKDRILDVACGTGIVGRLIHERVGSPDRLIGVDINPVMIGVARQLGPFAEYRLGSGTELQFEAGEFDLVLCQHGLMFFPDRARGLEEMRRVLGARGRLGLSTWRSLAENPVSEAFIHAGRRLVDAPIDLPFSMGDDRELAAMIAAAGFTDVQVDIVEVVAKFPDAATFVKMNAMAFGAVLPSFATMTDAERGRFVAGIESGAADVLAQHRDGSGLTFPVRANIATAIAG